MPRRSPIALAFSAVVPVALCLAGCTNFPDPANRAAVDGGFGAGAGALIGGVFAGPAAIPIGLLAGAAFGGTAGAVTPPSAYQIGPTFPW